MPGQHVQSGSGRRKLGSSHPMLFSSILICNLLFEMRDQGVFISSDLLDFLGQIERFYNLRA